MLGFIIILHEFAAQPNLLDVESEMKWPSLYLFQAPIMVKPTGTR